MAKTGITIMFLGAIFFVLLLTIGYNINITLWMILVVLTIITFAIGIILTIISLGQKIRLESKNKQNE